MDNDEYEKFILDKNRVDSMTEYELKMNIDIYYYKLYMKKYDDLCNNYKHLIEQYDKKCPFCDKPRYKRKGMLAYHFVSYHYQEFLEDKNLEDDLDFMFDIKDFVQDMYARLHPDNPELPSQMFP